MGWLADETGLERSAANHVALTPLSHLARAADVFPDRPAMIYGQTRRSYAQYHDRVTRLASALTAHGVRPGDVVATLLPNIPAHAEAHFGVPACGAIINTINTRLEADTVGYIFDHGGAVVLLCDTAFLPLAEAAIELQAGPPPHIIEVPDTEADFTATGRYPTYEGLLEQGDPDDAWHMPEDEWESIALNYTSGQRGGPKAWSATIAAPIC